MYSEDNKLSKRCIKGINDLLTTHPQLSKEWHPTLNGDLLPFDVSAGSNRKDDVT